MGFSCHSIKHPCIRARRGRAVFCCKQRRPGLKAKRVFWGVAWQHVSESKWGVGTAMVCKVKWHDKTQKKSSSCSSMLMMNLLVADSCLCMSGVGCYRLLSVFPVIIHFSWCPQSFLLQLGLFSSLQLVVSLLSEQNLASLRHHVSKIEQGAEQPRMLNGRSRTIKKNSWCIFFWLPLHRWSFVFFYRIIYNNAAHVSC